MMEVIATYGNRGVGVFWRLIERMRVATGYRLDTRLLAGIARSVDETPADTTQMLETFEAVGLFEREDEHFIFAPSLRRRMDSFEAVRKSRAEAGRKGGFSKAVANSSKALAKASNATAMLQHCQNDGLAKASLLNTNTNTTLNDLSTSLVGTDLGTNQVPDPKPTSRKVRTSTQELPPLPEHLDTATARAALTNWLDYKRERGEGYKPAGLNALILKISDWDELRLVRAVKHSTSSNYAGLFEPKAGEGGRPAKLSNLDKAKEIMRQTMMEAE